MQDKKSLWKKIVETWKNTVSMQGELDTVAAEERIRSGVWFKGSNVWILACSIVVASVGLNVNSIPVIIGAMLISPLMGPIIGIGLSLGINDSKLLGNALRNFLIMVVASLIFATLYFVISPLDIANPSELEARTSPTIYDVFIALFGGAAGMLETCRKERGTVLSGVAIATALMPPLCTAGYGIAQGSWHFFGGAMYLFIINTVFILFATLIVSQALHFDKHYDEMPGRKHFRTASTLILLVILVPSVISAVMMIRTNKMQRDLVGFVEENKTFGSAYIYDYKISSEKDHTAVVYFAGDLSENDLDLLKASAERHGLNPEKIEIKANAFGEKTDKILSGIYERADAELAQKEQRIKDLEMELEELKGDEIPYVQVTRELKYKYPQILDLSLSRGAVVSAEELNSQSRTNAVVTTPASLDEAALKEMTNWLRLRLNDTTVTVISQVQPQ